jgi:hypothetical protein
MPQWISDLISVSPVMGGIVLFIFILVVASVAAWKWLRPPTKGLNHFLVDWNGDEARPGVPARPGMMARVGNIEVSQRVTESHQTKTDLWFEKYGPIIDKLDHEMHPNSGSSMADAVNRTEKALKDHIDACNVAPAQTNITVTTAGAPTP